MKELGFPVPSVHPLLTGQSKIRLNDFSLGLNISSNLAKEDAEIAATSQTIIDHILTNVHDTVLTPGVFSYKLADHYPIFCKVSTSVCHTIKNDVTYTFRNHQAVDGQNFRNDLETALFSLTCD